MKRLLLFIFIGFQTVFAQESALSYEGQIGLFNTSFKGKYILNSGGFWDEQDKRDILSKMKTENHFFYKGEYALEYSNKNSWRIALKQKSLAYGTYTKDLIQLGLYGNTPFLGEELTLGPFQTGYYLYSEMELGFKIYEYFRLTTSVIIGHQFANFHATKANFYTTENGGAIDYDLELEAHYSEFEDVNDIFGNNGKGAALGIHYEKEKDGTLIQISASDIGFIRWDNECTNLYIDTSYHFECLAVDDLLNFNEGILQDEIDAIEGQFNTSVKENYSWRIPILIRAYYKQDLNHYFSAISFGSEHRIGLYTSPLFHANLHHKRKKVSGVLDTTMEEWNVLAYNLAMLYNVNKPNSVYTHDKLIFYYQRRCMGYTLALVLKKYFCQKETNVRATPQYTTY